MTKISAHGVPLGVTRRSGEPGRPGRGWAGTRGADQILAETHELAEPVYRAVVGALPATARDVAAYHIGWWDADGRPAVGQGNGAGQGKAVRPALTLACARAAGAQPGTAVEAAVAVEMVHDFSLLHDDVMDKDLTRRHRPAAWVVFGVSRAVLAGDMLLATAIRQLVKGRGQDLAAGILAEAVQELCEGQCADLAFEERSEVTVGECLAMAEAKTAALLGAACQLGAVAAGADEAVARRYRAFGRQLGVAFQLTDDLLGIWGDSGVTGKPAGSDLAARKKSLPVVAALCSGTLAGDQLARLYGRQGPLDEDALARAAGFVEAAGGRAWAQDEARRRVQAAARALAGARPSHSGAADLETLAALVTRRDR
jgi:geranylgeranyl diphosphate synthase, type I